MRLVQSGNGVGLKLVLGVAIVRTNLAACAVLVNITQGVANLSSKLMRNYGPLIIVHFQNLICPSSYE